MSRVMEDGLESLRLLAFRRFEQTGDMLKAFHREKALIDTRRDAGHIWNLYDWLLVPFSLWPLDFEGVSRHVLDLVQRKEELDEPLLLLIDLVGPPKPHAAYADIIKYEHLVQKGLYDELIKQPLKFREMEGSLAKDRSLKRAWKYIKENFDTTAFSNQRGVIRRRLSQERNFRPDWKFEGNSEKDRFLTLFDAFCFKWHLYGMEKDTPLLLKISVNPTPHGTMIMIPGHCSLDNKRDLDWRKIKKLHGVHGAPKQGPKLSSARLQRQEEAVRAWKLNEQAKSKGLRGDKRTDFVLRGMGKPLNTDSSWLKRLLRAAKEAL